MMRIDEIEREVADMCLDWASPETYRRVAMLQSHAPLAPDPRAVLHNGRRELPNGMMITVPPSRQNATHIFFNFPVQGGHVNVSVERNAFMVALAMAFAQRDSPGQSVVLFDMERT